jgi:hypothetical protein
MYVMAIEANYRSLIFPPLSLFSDQFFFSFLNETAPAISGMLGRKFQWAITDRRSMQQSMATSWLLAYISPLLQSP